MPRMRTVKPAICTSETLTLVDRGARYTFVLLWTHCDDEGRAVYNTRLLKAALYPLEDDITPAVVESDLALLADVGAVHIYEVAGRAYVHIPSWHEHQRPQHKVDSGLPPCPRTEHDVRPTVGVRENDVRAPGERSANGRHPQETPAKTGVSSEKTLKIGAPHVHRTADDVRPPPECTPVVVVVDVVGEVVVDVDVDVEGGGLGEDGNDETARQASPKTIAKPKTKPRTTAPDTFDVTLPLRSWAKSAGVNCNLTIETQQWLDHHRAKGTTAKDWVASWRTWMRNTTRWGGVLPTQPPVVGDW